MKKRTPLAPVIPSLDELDYLTLDDEQTIDGIQLVDQDLSYQDVHSLLVRQSVFQRVIMQRNHLVRFECSNVRFECCDFSNTEFIGGSFHQVVFHQCKLTGTNFAEGYLRDCVFEDCLGDYASFSATNIKDVHFQNTSLKQSDFFELTWKHLLIQHANLTGSNWLRTKLQGLDFTSNTFDSLLFSPENLKGLIVTPEQGLLIASTLGLIIE
ncbi:pentapeptide repeat-containing protein [Enterococcus faecalis]